MRLRIADERNAFLCHRRVLLDRKRLNWRSSSEHDEEMLAFVERSIKLRGFLLYMLGGPPLHRKAGFDPNQPRVPAGSLGAGQWTDGNGNPLRHLPDDVGPLDLAPQIPDVEPPSWFFNSFVKEAARWLAKVAIRETAGGPFIGTFLNALDVVEWGYRAYPYIQSYIDTPRTLGELQDAVLDPKRGYDIHHIVEQTAAARAGFSNDFINGRDNLVRIPTLKHWEITGWYMTKNVDFDGLSPREYLRDKSWEERAQVGRKALVIHGVLQP